MSDQLFDTIYKTDQTNSYKTITLTKGQDNFKLRLPLSESCKLRN